MAVRIYVHVCLGVLSYLIIYFYVSSAPRKINDTGGLAIKNATICAILLQLLLIKKSKVAMPMSCHTLCLITRMSEVV